MPEFRAFRALRYAADADLARVTAPPYDVLSDDEVDALQAKAPDNITFVDVPRGGAERYEQAAQMLQDWIARGILVRDNEPSLTIHRMRFVDDHGDARDLALVLGALEVVDEGAGGVLAHERTTPKASTDRLDLTRATRANLSPVWGLSLAAGLTDLLAPSGDLLGSVTADDVEHRVERITDPTRIAAISGRIESADVLIADGHHRYGVARAYRDEVREAAGSDTEAELTLACVGELVPEQLSVRAIHRLYSGATHGQLREALSHYFDLVPGPMPSLALLVDLERKDALALLSPDGETEFLLPKPGVFDDVRALDGVWLETALAGVPVDVTYQHGVDEVVEALATGRAHSGILIRPVSVAEIARTAHERLLMPPKSTFFTPKPLTGLVIRPLTVEDPS
ncbi:MAG: DUF1015 domain-containing protein [Phycicoccus sp.]|nr:DUF1015 domain-containing protein [Phycicoccus sp.]